MGSKTKLYIVGVIHAVLFVIEFCVSFRKDSIALLSDSYFNFFRAGTLILSGTQVIKIINLGGCFIIFKGRIRGEELGAIS